MTNLRSRVVFLTLTLLTVAAPAVRAQWITQSILIKPGWTAVYLHVDATYQSLDQLVGADSGNPIVQIWRWQSPASTLQFVTSPAAPLSTSSDWAAWTRPGSGVPVTLGSLTPNSAYLVHSIATTNYVWKVKGKPIAPNYAWTTTGLNFIGFSTVPSGAPAFDVFLSLAPDFGGAAEIYQYVGGDLGPSNPSRVIAPHLTTATRGQAFWFRAGTEFNDYFGPFQVSLTSSGEIAFGDTGSQYSFHLRNTTATNVTVTLRLQPSESPPTGQPVISGTPPVLLRGDLNLTNLTYGYTALSSSTTQSWTLKPKGQPGSDIAVVMGVNRSALANVQGAFYAGILRFTDSFGFLQVDVPVSARSASVAGLWVGKALVNQVGSYLKSYQRDLDNQPVMSPNGSYIVTNVDTSLGAVTQPFPLRLILHNDGSHVVLLQRVYYGMNAFSNKVVATAESVLDPAQLASARRISTIDLPWSSENAPWPVSGQLASGANLTTTVALPYDDQASNPFLHTYHPDHDNLDATFQNKLPRGSESYSITRQITLTINPLADDFASLTAAGQTFSGDYQETITLAGLGSDSRDFDVSGAFAITRISPVATLTQP